MAKRTFITALLLGLVCFLVYNANLRLIGSGDSWPARYLPLIVWHHGTLDFDESANLVAHGHPRILDLNRPAGAEGKVIYFEPWAYWLIRTRDNQLASLYPIITPLLVTPLYIPAVLWLNEHGWVQPHIGRVAEIMEKLSASLLASIASVLMFLVLRRDGTRWALPLALVFAFGTNTWMISSQALWQHGTGQLLVVLALLLALSRASPWRMALLGGVCVLMAVNRPPDALLAGAFALFIFWSHRRSASWFFVGTAVTLVPILYYNLFFIGHLLGGYSIGVPHYVNFLQLNWSGITGLLISPTRGLLVFSPFLVFIIVGLIQRLREPRTKRLAVVLTVAAVAQILFYSQTDWRAGFSWGPRFLTDILPILVWMLAPAPLVLRPMARGLLVVLMGASIVVQSIGAFWYTGKSDLLVYAGNIEYTGNFESMAGAWNPGNVPFLTELGHPPARGELAYDARGSLERVGHVRVHELDEPPRLEPGAELKGWALVGGRTPAYLFALIDGIIIGATTDFLPRVDVNEAMHTTSPSGWRVFANLWGVAPGERVLQIAVRIEPGSDIRIIREQRVFVVAQQPAQVARLSYELGSLAELDVLAQRAASLLREHQAVDGYWLTKHTRGLHYDAPQPEMNTFLTSMLVDLLTPVAHQYQLDDAMLRAREHLAAQIESDGLVRYHGSPAGPTIGRLGCVITPDSDDTALVWRIAGPGVNDQRQQRMLEILDQYRDARGLYRTWLAPQRLYQCIDPGRAPNPTDVAIQMHIYMMLRELDPPAAQSLCDALKHSFGDEDIWVYYAKSPLVPYLRSVELEQLGCEIPQPTERLALPAAGQEIWSEAARLLVETMVSAPTTDRRREIRNVLERLGKDNFAEIRRAPPLLYHNDMTASVRRFYWSEDFGYALWLRLYQSISAENDLYQQSSS